MSRSLRARGLKQRLLKIYGWRISLERTRALTSDFAIQCFMAINQWKACEETASLACYQVRVLIIAKKCDKRVPLLSRSGCIGHRQPRFYGSKNVKLGTYHHCVRL